MIQTAEGLIRERISHRGSIPFDEYMDIALYSELGYYRQLDHIGTKGDYYTSPRVHPLFGSLVCAQLFKMWEFLHEPRRFMVIEQGAGDSVLAEDILNTAKQIDLRFYQSLDYTLYDVRSISTATQKARSVQSSSIDLRGITGVVISNELLDAFPVKSIEILHGQVKELFVTTDSDGNLVEELSDPSDEILEGFFSEKELESLSGYRGPVNLRLRGWLANMFKVIKKGFLITVDYGYEREMYYSAEKSRKLLQTFYMHTDGSSPFQRIGKQDITAHVDFTALKDAGTYEGFTTVYEGKQYEWLNGLGFESLSRKIRGKSEYRRETNIMNQLVSKDGLGAFNVLIQGKGLPNSRGQYTTPFNFWDGTQIEIAPTESHMSWNPNYNTV